jgi:hypothetical protein
LKTKIYRLNYAHEENIMGKRIEIKASDYPNTLHIPTEQELVSVVKKNGEPCVIDKINEIIDHINLPWYKKLFYKSR